MSLFFTPAAMDSLSSYSIQLATSLNIPCPLPSVGQPMSLNVLLPLLIRVFATLLWRNKCNLLRSLLISFLLCRLVSLTGNTLQCVAEVSVLKFISHYSSVENIFRFVIMYFILKIMTTKSVLVAIVWFASALILVIFNCLIICVLGILRFLKMMLASLFRR